VKARVHLAQGELDRVLRWMAESNVALDDHPEFSREYAHLTLVRAHLALHHSHGAVKAQRPAAGIGDADLTGVLGLLDRLEGSAIADARHGSVLEVRLLQALTMHARGDDASAVERLASAAAAAPEVDAYARLFLDGGPTLVTLLQQAPHLAVEAHADVLTSFAERLLLPDRSSGHSNTAAAEEPGRGRRPADLPDSLSEREMEVLGLLASELTGPEIARHLFISLNTLRTHTKRIFTKLDATNRAAAVRRGRELNLI
jgi:LuxR family maltose regulon positive regulatory protein